MSLEDVAIQIVFFMVVFAVFGFLLVELLKIRDLCFLKKVVADLQTRNLELKNGRHDNLRIPLGTMILRLPSGLTIEYHRHPFKYHDEPPINTVTVYQEGGHSFSTILTYGAWGNKILWPSNLTKYERTLCRDIVRELEIAMAA